jgi:hypothetical protein
VHAKTRMHYVTRAEWPNWAIFHILFKLDSFINFRSSPNFWCYFLQGNLYIGSDAIDKKTPTFYLNLRIEDDWNGGILNYELQSVAGNTYVPFRTLNNLHSNKRASLPIPQQTFMVEVGIGPMLNFFIYVVKPGPKPNLSPTKARLI